MYWIIGGEFSSLNFHSIKEGTIHAEGPFETREQAEEKWKELSYNEKYKATKRFKIVKE